MRTRVALSLMVCILLAVLLASCGGGGDQSGDKGGSQDGGGSQKRGGEQQGAAAQKVPRSKIAVGTIASVSPDEVVLEPSTIVQSDGPLAFEIEQNTEITVNEQEAELADVKRGQDAQIYYVVRNNKNRALKVAVIGGS